MKKFTALVVDDELAGIRTLVAKIEWSQLPVFVIGQVNSVTRAIQVLQNETPDIIFLDVRMPQENGFELFQYIDVSVTDVILTTAHEEYALKAFNERAVGYLLKPISQRDFNALLTPLIAKRYKESSRTEIVSVKSNRTLINIDPKEILYIHSEGVKSRIFTLSQGEILVSSILKTLEADLPKGTFYRIHHQIVINLSHVTQVYQGKYSKVSLSNGHELEVSRSKKKDFYFSYCQFLGTI